MLEHGSIALAIHCSQLTCGVFEQIRSDDASNINTTHTITLTRCNGSSYVIRIFSVQESIILLIHVFTEMEMGLMMIFGGKPVILEVEMA